MTHLIIKWEPGDVNVAGGFEDAGWDLLAIPVMVDNDVGRVGSIKVLIRAVIQEYVRSPHVDGRNSDVLVEERKQMTLTLTTSTHGDVSIF